MARLIDLTAVLSVLFAGIVVQLFWFVGPLSDRFAPEPWGRRLVATVLFVVLSGVYEVVFVAGSRGQTPGKDVMDLRVIRAAPDADGCGDDRCGVSARRAAIRWAPIGLLPLLPTAWSIVAVAAVVAGPLAAADRRSLADRIARTRVVGYVRDHEDPTARRPVGRSRRRRERENAGGRP